MMDYNSIADEELVTLLKQGDPGAFSALFERYWQVLYRYASADMSNHEDARDIVQDLFTHLWETRSGLEIHTSVKAFLYRAVVNRIINQVKKTKFSDQYLVALQQEMDKKVPAPDEQLFEKEMIERYENGLQSLPGKTREVFELSRQVGLSHEQIAHRLNISGHTVRWHIKSALKALRKFLVSQKK